MFRATRDTLTKWTEKLRQEAGEGFPKEVTALHPDMAVHGRFGKPCVACGTQVQRIVYAESETNYCPRCQTGGRLLADRALSKLLHNDWPKTIEELEANPLFGPPHWQRGGVLCRPALSLVEGRRRTDGVGNCRMAVRCRSRAQSVDNSGAGDIFLQDLFWASNSTVRVADS